MPDPKAYPTPIAAKLTGLTTARLDDWYRRGILKPSIAHGKGHGVSRVWSFADLVAMRMVDDVRLAGGLSQPRLAKAIRYVRKHATLREMSATTFVVIRSDDVFELDLVADGLPLTEICEGGLTVLPMLRVGLIVQQLLGAARALHAA